VPLSISRPWRGDDSTVCAGRRRLSGQSMTPTGREGRRWLGDCQEDVRLLLAQLGEALNIDPTPLRYA
jgi:hypothetical protein